jgi:hypothetical protein
MGGNSGLLACFSEFIRHNASRSHDGPNCGKDGPQTVDHFKPQFQPAAASPHTQTRGRSEFNFARLDRSVKNLYCFCSLCIACTAVSCASDARLIHLLDLEGEGIAENILCGSIASVRGYHLRFAPVSRIVGHLLGEPNLTYPVEFVGGRQSMLCPLQVRHAERPTPCHGSGRYRLTMRRNSKSDRSGPLYRADAKASVDRKR